MKEIVFIENYYFQQYIFTCLHSHEHGIQLLCTCEEILVKISKVFVIYIYIYIARLIYQK